VTTSKLGTSSVTGAKILTGSVTTTKLGSGSVTTSKLGSDLTFTGVLSAPDQIRAYVTRSGDVTIPNAAFTNVSFDTESEDVGNIHVASTMTVTSSGWYTASCQVRWTANATGNRALRLVQNGATELGYQFGPTASGADMRTSTTWTGRLAANDTLVCEAQQTSGGDLVLKASNSYFSLIKLW